MSVYVYLEAFTKLEKRLSEGQEGPAAARGQPAIHDLRSKLDKFIKALGPCDIQVPYTASPAALVAAVVLIHGSLGYRCHSYPHLFRIPPRGVNMALGKSSLTPPHSSTVQKKVLISRVHTSTHRTRVQTCTSHTHTLFTLI